LRDFWTHHTRDAPSGSQASSTGPATCRNRRFRRVDAKVCPSMVRQRRTLVEVTISWGEYCVTSLAWAWAMMPISHYVRLMLSHGVQMCSFFSMICCERLENAPRYECSLKQLSLVMNIGYLGFDGPSERSPSVSGAKTAETLICTFGSKMGLFWGFGGIFRRGSYPFP
jgi:hypothetical protein